MIPRARWLGYSECSPHERSEMRVRWATGPGYRCAHPGYACSINFYLRYLDYCTKLADKWDMSLRDLDRALWQRSKDKSEAA